MSHFCGACGEYDGKLVHLCGPTLPVASRRKSYGVIRPVETTGTTVFGKCPEVSAQMSPCWGDLREHAHQPEQQPESSVTVQCVVCGNLLVAARTAAVEAEAI